MGNTTAQKLDLPAIIIDEEDMPSSLTEADISMSLSHKIASSAYELTSLIAQKAEVGDNQYSFGFYNLPKPGGSELVSKLSAIHKQMQKILADL